MNVNTQANRQWAERPADERFASLSDLHSSCISRDNRSQDDRLYFDRLNITVNGDIRLVGDGLDARLTHWSAGQLCQKLSVPRDLLAKLNPAVATAVMMDRLPKSIAEGTLWRGQRILKGGYGTPDATVRAFHGDTYERVWDKQVTSMLMEYLPPGWRNPVAYDGGKWGAPLTPSGLYAGDRDLFAFFIDGGDQRDGGGFDVDGERFFNGFYVWNSEVGAKSLGWSPFKFRYVCGNNMVWGIKDMQVVRAAHRGNALNVLRQLRRWLDTVNSGTDTRFAEAVRAAKSEIAVPIVQNKLDETLTQANAKFARTFTRTNIADALTAVLREETNVRGTRWDWLQGFTAVARTLPNADARTDMERTAADLLLTK